MDPGGPRIGSHCLGWAGDPHMRSAPGPAAVPADAPCHPTHNQNKPSTLARDVSNTCGQLSPLSRRHRLHVPPMMVLMTVLVSLLLPGAMGHPLWGSGGISLRGNGRHKRELIDDQTVGATDLHYLTLEHDGTVLDQDGTSRARRYVSGMTVRRL